MEIKIHRGVRRGNITIMKVEGRPAKINARVKDLGRGGDEIVLRLRGKKSLTRDSTRKGYAD